MSPKSLSMLLRYTPLASARVPVTLRLGRKHAGGYSADSSSLSLPGGGISSINVLIAGSDEVRCSPEAVDCKHGFICKNIFSAGNFQETLTGFLSNGVEHVKIPSLSALYFIMLFKNK